MQVVRDVEALKTETSGEGVVGFVPTMGALHEGHLSLIRQAAGLARPVVVSLFVNPTQFGPGEDFARYPRQLDADVEMAAEAGAEVVFAPSVETMYPPGEETPVPPLPEVATRPGLEDAHRPGHFAGVCQVVARLFDLVLPRFAVFGEKDYQQLLVIRAMTVQESDRWPGLEIITGRTIREPDGLAMSSRNAYLDAGQRKQALALSRGLQSAQSAASPGEAETIMLRALETGGLSADYAVVRDAETLLPIESFSRPARGLIAARVGNIRLIDNMGMEV
ncbi:MAG: pantoate--beta-alanine ligase [Phycisphaerales bacterium]|nr:MAG: pantoate--beta-alanine ligase [Phycisphaerales bacterium]